MNKAVVTLLICSFRGGQATIAHYLYVLTYYIIAVTGGGCFERTEISFISFRWRIQQIDTITYPFEEQPDSRKQIHWRSRWYSLQGAFSQEKKAQNQIYLNTKRDRLHYVSGLWLYTVTPTNWNLRLSLKTWYLFEYIIRFHANIHGCHSIKFCFFWIYLNYLRLGVNVTKVHSAIHSLRSNNQY